MMLAGWGSVGLRLGTRSAWGRWEQQELVTTDSRIEQTGIVLRRTELLTWRGWWTDEATGALLLTPGTMLEVGDPPSAWQVTEVLIEQGDGDVLRLTVRQV